MHEKNLVSIKFFEKDRNLWYNTRMNLQGGTYDDDSERRTGRMDTVAEI